MLNYHPRSKHVGIVLLVSLCTGIVNADTKNYAGGFVLTRIFDGHTIYKRCELRVRYGAGWVEDGGGGIAWLICAPNAHRSEDLYSERRLSDVEITLIQTLAESSDLYNGGHIGTSGGPPPRTFETITAGCCGRRGSVVLVTYGNPTFEKAGPRRRLLTLLRKWQDDLLRTAEETRRSRPK